MSMCSEMSWENDFVFSMKERAKYRLDQFDAHYPPAAINTLPTKACCVLSAPLLQAMQDLNEQTNCKQEHQDVGLNIFSFSFSLLFFSSLSLPPFVPKVDSFSK